MIDTYRTIYRFYFKQYFHWILLHTMHSFYPFFFSSISMNFIVYTINFIFLWHLFNLFFFHTVKFLCIFSFLFGFWKIKNIECLRWIEPDVQRKAIHNAYYIRISSYIDILFYWYCIMFILPCISFLLISLRRILLL